jgi:hypothetical protein
MGINVGGILGGIAGLMVPGSTFLAPAIGAGLGTLAGGGSSKNAIKYALLGAGVGGLTSLGPTLQNTALGKAVGPTFGKFAGQGATKTAASDTATKGLLSLQNPFVQAAVLSAAVGKPEQPTTYTGTGNSEGYDGSSIDRSGFLDNLYASRFDGTRFNTAAERDEYDRNLKESQNIVQGMSSGGLYATGGQIEGLGGLIEGPGTGTSDDIPAMIYQDGNPVQKAMLSNGEVVLSLKDLRNIGGGDAEMAGKMIGDAPNGTRGAVAAKLFRNMQEFKNG